MLVHHYREPLARWTDGFSGEGGGGAGELSHLGFRGWHPESLVMHAYISIQNDHINIYICVYIYMCIHPWGTSLKP